jgi:hypothetical protein
MNRDFVYEHWFKEKKMKKEGVQKQQDQLITRVNSW